MAGLRSQEKNGIKGYTKEEEIEESNIVVNIREV